MCWKHNGVFPHKVVDVEDDEKENKSLYGNLVSKSNPTTQPTNSEKDKRKKEEVAQLYGIYNSIYLLHTII